MPEISHLADWSQAIRNPKVVLSHFDAEKDDRDDDDVWKEMLLVKG